MPDKSKAAPWRVCRRVRLSTAVPDNLLQEIAGVIEFRALSAQNWLVIYDVRAVQFATIAAALQGVSLTPWCWRWQIAWRQFQDVNNRDNLLAQDGPCCNRPPRQR